MQRNPPSIDADPAAAIRAAAGGAGSAINGREPVITIDHLSKSFGTARVLRDLSLELRAGDVHALIGENGSGKSTLIKCLSGFYVPDAGSAITVDGKDVTRSVGDCAFAFVHQDLGLVTGLSVLENVALVQGFGSGPLSRINWRSERSRVADLLERYGLSVDPATPVASLGAAERALVAIMRAVENKQRPCRLLVLDEPTAALPEAGRERVLAIVRQMASRGIAVLYVSHRLREILDLAQEVTVLRDGQRVGTYGAAGLTEKDLVERMMGRDLAGQLRRTPAARRADSPVMRVSDLSGGAVSDLTFEVRPGEIVSLTGLLGAGQNDVGKLLFGASPRSSGEVQVDGRSVRAGDPPSAISAGIAYIPADRVNESTLALLSVRENVTLPKLRAHARRGRLSRRAEREFASRLVQDFDVRPPDPELKMHQLSGGNQQKAIIGKWLSIAPKVLIVDEPTQGVDVGARAQIYRLLEHAAGAGMAIVMVDTDLGEVERLSDRVLVFTDGRCHAELYGSEITRLRMTQLMNAQAVSPTAELEGTDDDDAVLTERAQGGSDA